MSIARWDPFRNVNALQDRINRMFDDVFPRNLEDEELSLCAWKPLVDIYDSEEGIVITADLPGVAKGDVSVEMRNNVLTLKGERRPDPAGEDDRYLRRERCFGSFQRSFSLKSSVPPDKIKANFKDGVLAIRLPRPDDDLPRQIAVNVE